MKLMILSRIQILKLYKQKRKVKDVGNVREKEPLGYWQTSKVFKTKVFKTVQF